MNRDDPAFALPRGSAEAVTKRRRVYLLPDQVSAPFHLAMATPDLNFTILYRSILLHSLWRQAVDTWEKIHIWEQIQFGWQNLPLIGPT